MQPKKKKKKSWSVVTPIDDKQPYPLVNLWNSTLLTTEQLSSGPGNVLALEDGIIIPSRLREYPGCTQQRSIEAFSMGVSEPQRTSTPPSVGITSSIHTEVNLSGPHLPLTDQNPSKKKKKKISPWKCWLIAPTIGMILFLFPFCLYSLNFPFDIL